MPQPTDPAAPDRGIPSSADPETRARALIAQALPDRADEALTALPGTSLPDTSLPGTSDLAAFRLGPQDLLRLAMTGAGAEALTREAAFLPRIGPRLPVDTPTILRHAGDRAAAWTLATPPAGHPPSAQLSGPTLSRLAGDLAATLRALQALPVAGGPRPGPANGEAGGALAEVDGAFRALLSAAPTGIDRDAATTVWDTALATTWQHAPVWVHGSLTTAALHLTHGRLTGLSHWQAMAVGDPACDLTLAWSLFSGEARAGFRLGLPLDSDTWTRARGWALLRALRRRDDGAGDGQDTAALVADIVTPWDEGLEARTIAGRDPL